MRIPLLVAPAIATLFVLTFTACATPGTSDRRSGERSRDSRTLTADEIAESGARDAWEAVRHTAGLALTEGQGGRPSGMSSRGRSSFHLDDTPIVVVDGMRIGDFRILRDIPAHTIFTIEVLNGVQGTLKYGTGSGGGAVVVTTRSHDELEPDQSDGGRPLS